MDTTYTSVYTTFRNPGLFGKLGLQSMRWKPGFRPGNQEMLQDAPRQDLVLYLDWGKYDIKYETESFDVRAFSIAFAEDLRAAGYTCKGGEIHEGPGLDSWIQRPAARNTFSVETVRWAAISGDSYGSHPPAPPISWLEWAGGCWNGRGVVTVWLQWPG